MGWARLDDGWHDHRKVAAVGLEAAGLWVMCLTWAHRDRRGSKAAGVVPDSVIGRFAGRKGSVLCARLFDAGLFDAKTEHGWPIHDFGDYLPRYDSDTARANGSRGGKARAAKQTASKPLANGAAVSSTRASARRNPVPVPTELPDGSSAQTLIGEWLDHCDERPPERVVGHASKEVANLLTEGIDPARVRQGLADWHHKGQHPSTIPSFVNAAMNGHTRSTTNRRTSEALDLAAEYAQQEATDAEV